MSVEAGAKDKDKEKGKAFFGLDRVLTAHLKFSAKEWDSIKPDEPAGGMGFPGFGGPGPGGRPGGPGGAGGSSGPGAGPGAPGGGFGPGAMLTGVFQRELDANKDGKVSKDEFGAGFKRWFTAWDGKQAGYLDADAIRDGMNKNLNPFQAPAGAPAGGTPPPGSISNTCTRTWISTGRRSAMWRCGTKGMAPTWMRGTRSGNPSRWT